ncbi:MAG: hypothetical protein ACI4SB_05200 [Acutalibacteraceae bacterium]
MKNKKDAVVAIMLFNMANDEAKIIIEKNSTEAMKNAIRSLLTI